MRILRFTQRFTFRKMIFNQSRCDAMFLLSFQNFSQCLRITGLSFQNFPLIFSTHVAAHIKFVSLFYSKRALYVVFHTSANVTAEWNRWNMHNGKVTR